MLDGKLSGRMKTREALINSSHVIPAKAGIQIACYWIPGLRYAPPGMTIHQNFLNP
jgi:hypothetical protein